MNKRKGQKEEKKTTLLIADFCLNHSQMFETYKKHFKGPKAVNNSSPPV